MQARAKSSMRGGNGRRNVGRIELNMQHCLRSFEKNLAIQIDSEYKAHSVWLLDQ
jgi:hypothetical protein